MNYRNVDELRPQGKKKGSIGFRPNLSIVFVLVFGIFLIVMFRNAVGIVSGLIVTGISLVYLFAVKEHPVADVYEKELLVYEASDPRRGVLIPCEEVKEYYIPREDSADIRLRLMDGEVLILQSMQKNKAQYLFDKVMPKKASDDHNLKERRRFFRK